MNISLIQKRVSIIISPLCWFYTICICWFAWPKLKGNEPWDRPLPWKIAYWRQYGSFWSSCPEVLQVHSPGGKGSPRWWGCLLTPLCHSRIHSKGLGFWEAEVIWCGQTEEFTRFWTFAQDWWENINWNSRSTWEKGLGLHTTISTGTLKWSMLDWRNRK